MLKYFVAGDIRCIVHREFSCKLIGDKILKKNWSTFAKVTIKHLGTYFFETPCRLAQCCRPVYLCVCCQSCEHDILTTDQLARVVHACNGQLWELGC